MLELKQIGRFHHVGLLLAFNRTMLELKLRNFQFRNEYGSTFNRTMLELKHVLHVVMLVAKELLIEPCWN